MDTVDLGHLIYLILLLLMVAGWFIVQQRERLSQTLQHAAIWVFIFLGVIAAIGLWDDIRRTIQPRAALLGNSEVVIPRSPDGHYYVTLSVNNAPIRFVVDTGATDIVLSTPDAARAGLDPKELDYIGRAGTANGIVRTAPIRLNEISFGPIVDRNVAAVVSEGEMPGSLLGMGYLERWGSLQISGGQMILRR